MLSTSNLASTPAVEVAAAVALYKLGKANSTSAQVTQFIHPSAHSPNVPDRNANIALPSTPTSYHFEAYFNTSLYFSAECRLYYMYEKHSLKYKKGDLFPFYEANIDMAKDRPLLPPMNIDQTFTRFRKFLSNSTTTIFVFYVISTAQVLLFQMLIVIFTKTSWTNRWNWRDLFFTRQQIFSTNFQSKWIRQKKQQSLEF